MKFKLLGAVASVAFISTGVAAMAQDAPKHDQQRPAAERAEPRAPAAAPKAEGEAPRAAQMERREEPAGKEAPRAAQNQREEQPGAAMKREPKAAEGERKEAPKAAQSEPRKDMPKAAQSEPQKGEMQKGERNEPRAAEGERDRTPGANEQNRQRAAEGDRNRNERNNQRDAQRRDDHPRVMGNIKISNEHATRITETLRRDARPEHVDIDVRVGVRVPETIVVRPLPPEVVTLAPEYRGYNYFIDESDEIVFVSPETHEIVGSIDYEGRAASEGDATRVSAARPCPTED